MSNANEHKFNRSAYMALITTITIASVFLGSILHLGRGLLFLRHTGATVSGIEEVSAFAGVDLEMDAGNLTIQKGSEYSVSYEGYPVGKEPRYEVKGDTLVLTQKMEVGLTKSSFPSGCSVTLTIPEGASPELDLELSMGGLELKDLALGTVSMDLDMGGCTVTDCTMGGFHIDADMGAITFTDCTMGNGSMDADMGSITLKNYNFDDATFAADMGGIKISDATFASADCKADMGSVEVSGTFATLSADCGMGSIKVTTASDGKDANMDLVTDMGKITVNGENHGSRYIHN